MQAEKRIIKTESAVLKIDKPQMSQDAVSIM